MTDKNTSIASTPNNVLRVLNLRKYFRCSKKFRIFYVQGRWFCEAPRVPPKATAPPFGSGESPKIAFDRCAQALNFRQSRKIVCKNNKR